MILGIMSDTHGHLTEMRQAARRMVEEFGVDVIIHLGDDSTDADELAGLGVDVISVPGVFEERYRNPGIPNRIIKEFDGIPVLITHTPTRNSHDLEDDIDPTEAVQTGEAKVVLYGHTHVGIISEKHGGIYINPGHLNPKDKRGEPLTFAIIKLTPPKINIRIFDLAGQIRMEKDLSY